MRASNEGPRPGLQDSLITETIEVIEEPGPLEDEAAMRAAVAHGGDRATQIVTRARLLGRRFDLAGRIERAHHLAPLVLIGLAALVVLIGFGLGRGIVTDPGGRINVMAALASLLGPHLLTFAFWLLALLWPHPVLGHGLGALWLRATSRLGFGKGAEAGALGRAALRLLTRARLTPWLAGLASHLIWALVFAAATGTLLFALSFRSYTLNWETTILEPATFESWIRGLGVVPGWFGFPTPDEATIRAPVAGSAGQRVWGLWLIGCLVCYGLVPRIIASLVCAAVWHAGRSRVGPDFDAPYHRRLFARLDALAPAVVIETDPFAGHATVQVEAAGSDHPRAGECVIGFELPPEWHWPLPALEGRSTAGADDSLRVDGSARARNAALTRVLQRHPRRVVVVCHAASSPDRGTARFIRDLLGDTDACLIWLAAGPDGGEVVDEAALRRWGDWLQTSGLAAVELAALSPSPPDHDLLPR